MTKNSDTPAAEPAAKPTTEDGAMSPDKNVGEVNRVAAVASASSPTPADKPDTFESLKKLRISQVFMAGTAEKLISSYSVRKPKKNAFFRVHPSEDYEVEAFIYADKDEGGMEKEKYLVDTVFVLQLGTDIRFAF
jgi:hypothetical protein